MAKMAATAVNASWTVVSLLCTLAQVAVDRVRRRDPGFAYGMSRRAATFAAVCCHMMATSGPERSTECSASATGSAILGSRQNAALKLSTDNSVSCREKGTYDY